MLTAVSKYQVWVILVCLTALTMPLEGLAGSRGKLGWDNSLADKNPSFEVADSATVIIAAGERTRQNLHNHLVLLFHGLIVFERESLSFPSRNIDHPINCACLPVGLIRAPPFQYAA
jgi:hypothetical protein